MAALTLTWDAFISISSDLFAKSLVIKAIDRFKKFTIRLVLKLKPFCELAITSLE